MPAWIDVDGILYIRDKDYQKVVKENAALEAVIKSQEETPIWAVNTKKREKELEAQLMAMRNCGNCKFKDMDNCVHLTQNCLNFINWESKEVPR